MPYGINVLVGIGILVCVSDSILVQGHICGFRAYEEHMGFMNMRDMSVKCI